MRQRPSQRPKNVRYYAANRAREIDRVTRRQAATTAFLRLLRQVPCADCGGRFEPHQMDFDHREPSTKAFNLCAGRAALKSRAQLLAEAAKCDIVCANCHRAREKRRSDSRLALKPHRSLYLSEIERYERFRRQQELIDELRAVPCADCHRTFDAYAMEFDHVNPADKSATVSRMVGRTTDGEVLAEVAKCDIVCANCHRLRTFVRRSKRTA